MMNMRHMKILGVTLAVLLIAAGCATTRPERQWERPEDAAYYEMGVATADSVDSVYKSAVPVFGGVLTGIVVPASFLFLLRSEAFIGASIVGSMSVIAGSNSIIEKSTIKTPSQFLVGSTELQRKSFELGYSDRVKDLRKGRYASGVMIGVIADIGFFAWVISQLQAMDGV